MKKIILAISAIALFTVACNKAKTTTDVTSNKLTSKKVRTVQTAQDEIKYDIMITTVAYGLLDISSNDVFKNILKTEIAKQFDGDDNVLLKTLNSKCIEAGLNLETSMTNSLIAHGKRELTSNVHDAINGFAYFDTKIYLQVYIPFVEGKDLLGSQAPICMNFEDEPVLEGIKLTNGVVNIADVTEDDARLNTTWVISGNERVDDEGNIPVNNGKNERFDEANKTTGVDGDVVLKVKQIFITDKKEGWGNGRADINHITYIFRPGCTLDNNNSARFSELAKPDLNTWFTVGSPAYGASNYLSNDFLYWADWQPSLHEDLHTLFYEHDQRKKFNRDETISPWCSNQVHYCSKEDPYGIIHPDYHDFSNSASQGWSEKDYQLIGGTFKINGFTIQ